MTSRTGIYFVGEPSASGKSTVTTEIAREHDVPRIELDDLYNCLDFIQDKKLRVETMNTATESFLRMLVVAGADMIVEGGWLWPTTAARLVNQSGGKFCAVFCGYPNASTQSRLELLHTHSGKKHWITCKPEAEALSWIAEQISASTNYKQAAEAVQLAFFDLTDPKEGSKGLLQHYRSWRQKT